MRAIASFRKSTIVAIVCMLNLCAAAQMQLIEIEELQLSKSSAGVVIDPSGATIPHVTIEERSDDWKIVLRTTHSDEEGRFHFSRHSSRVVHLEFSCPGFNRLRIRVRLDKKGEAKLVIKMSIAT
jgi:hypothetical protein